MAQVRNSLLAIRLTDGERERLEFAAERDGRSLSGQVRHYIRQAAVAEDELDEAAA